MCLQDDTAKDEDIHTGISKELKSHFVRKPRSTSHAAGIALIAVSNTVSIYFLIPWGERCPYYVKNYGNMFTISTYQFLV